MSVPAIPAEVLAAMKDGFVVAILLEANDGDIDKVVEIQRWLTPLSQAEPGVKLFLPYQSPTNPALFFVFELYVDEAGWKAHQETEHFKRAIPQLLPLLKRRERIPFVPIF
jgi:quinol monooxygenase YgiN